MNSTRTGTEFRATRTPGASSHSDKDGTREMMNQKTKYAFLSSIEEREGEWGWYQFEHAFPPGWFADEPAGATARGFLEQLEAEGLVTTTPGEPWRRFHLTDQGRAALARIATELASG